MSSRAVVIPQEAEAPPLSAIGPAAGGERVYHISIVGLRIGPEWRIEALPHAPVSRETLDASVTRLAERHADFPSADEGIAMWRADQGGVFTITLAEIAAAVEGVLAGVQRADGKVER